MDEDEMDDYKYDSDEENYNYSETADTDKDENDSVPSKHSHSHLINSVGSSQVNNSQSSTKLKIPDGSYFISEYSAISLIMEALISEVASLLDVDIDTAQILLQSTKWSKERLLDQFFGGSEKLLQNCGMDQFSPSIVEVAQAVNNLNTSSSSSSSVASSFGNPSLSASASTTTTSTNVFNCRICCDTCPSDASFCLGCNHSFCIPCYKEYLRNLVLDGPACITGHCPQYKCKQTVPRGVFTSFLARDHAAVLDKYKIYVIRNFIEMTKGLQYCPAPGCDKVAVGLGVSTVRCGCGSVFCCKCGEEAHEPCTCAQLVDWNHKCMNESETANWILANTKKCPNCNARIEKNQGCNHMNCKMCKYEFCWICMGLWSDHSQSTGGYYKCNRYESVVQSTDTSAAQKAKAELDRYLHYYQRYHAHDHSLKFAATTRQQAEQKMAQQQEAHRSAWIDVQFLLQAVDQVVDCRRVLKYTYALGYFLADNSPEKHLFEHQQEMLEKNTERLHEFTEQPIHSLDRTQVVNLTRVTERFMNELLSTTEGGVVDTSATMLSSSPNSSSFMNNNNNNGSNNSSSGLNLSSMLMSPTGPAAAMTNDSTSSSTHANKRIARR